MDYNKPNIHLGTQSLFVIFCCRCIIQSVRTDCVLCVGSVFLSNSKDSSECNPVTVVSESVSQAGLKNLATILAERPPNLADVIT